MLRVTNLSITIDVQLVWISQKREDMEEINHFSHKNHPLKLVTSETIVSAALDNYGGGVIGCYACQKPIPSSDFAYACIPCRHFMHKACAQLPLTINLPSLYEYPITLFDFGPTTFKSWFCDVCCSINQCKGFCYSFEKPEYNIYFNACIDCCVVEIARIAEADAMKKETGFKIEHEGHHPQHILTLQLKPAAFLCDACNTEDKGLFYICDSCGFWIHKTCATLAPSIHLPHHPYHPLILVYSLPEKFYKFAYYCEFCKIYIRRYDWLYHCENCRYFSHIKCALNANAGTPSTPRDGPSTSNADEEVDNLLQFPMPNAFTDPLKLLHYGMIASDDDADRETMINHWSHHHPLILQANMSGCSSDQLEVCHGCVRLLSLPYYSCKSDGCPFTLHKYCAELPLKLEHQLHPTHSLELTLQQGSIYECNGCFSDGNNFFYQCQTCEFYLCVSCAYLPKSIKHKSHKHPLIQVIDPEPLCKACSTCSNIMSYACKACNFILGMECAIRLPISISHRYCKGHDIPLMYPPIMDHPEDFFCDVCEMEMHPKLPMYYCHKCKNSFHPTCISWGDCNLTLLETWVLETEVSVAIPSLNVVCDGSATDSLHR
ncbi:unnamed protein product [Lactuca saligna]|uniref:Zinc finger PHD-type domain-containing protein n=1 Tax=Lactuca saligna TaxID=75948 RepID=A0AA35YBB5_LACSI|nr:unnamed protein product [Lactuca saligna]